MSQYTICRGDQIIGEFSAEEIKDKINTGDLLESDLAYTEGFADWESISEIPELMPSGLHILPIPVSSPDDQVGLTETKSLFSKPLLIGSAVAGVLLFVAVLILVIGGGEASGGSAKNAITIKGVSLGMDLEAAVTALKNNLPSSEFKVYDPSKSEGNKSDAQGMIDLLKGLNSGLNKGTKTKQADTPPISFYAKSNDGLVTIGADNQKKWFICLLKVMQSTSSSMRKAWTRIVF